MSSFTRVFCLALSLSIPAVCAASAGAANSEVIVKNERRIRFTSDWRFFKGEAAGAEAPEFNDSAWRVLNLPHDWAIEGPFDKQYEPNTGGLPVSGTGWYRKHFTLREIAKGRHFSIEFDGAMSNAHVWLNGKEIGSRPYGYSSFAFDLTPNLHWDGDNVLAVRLTPEPESSRWYPGAGIYRNVWLTVTGPVHVAHWGTYVTTPEVTAAKATVAITTEIQNDGAVGATALQIVTTPRLWTPGGHDVSHYLPRQARGWQFNVENFSAKFNIGVEVSPGQRQANRRAET